MYEKNTYTHIARESKKKTSFILEYKDLETIEKFTYEQKGKVLTYISDFVMRDIEPDITTVEGIAANFFIQTIEKNNQRYLDICKKNARNRKHRDGKDKEDESEPEEESQNQPAPEAPASDNDPDDELPF